MRISGGVAGLVVVGAIELDSKARLRAIEVEDEVAVRMLATETAAHRLPPQCAPQRRLLRRHLMPQRAAQLPDVFANTSHTEYPEDGVKICAEISGFPPPILGAGLGVGGAHETATNNTQVPAVTARCDE